MRDLARRLVWLLGYQAQWCGVVSPDQLVMDTTTVVALEAGECRAYQIAVTAVMAASDRGLLVEVSFPSISGVRSSRRS